MAISVATPRVPLMPERERFRVAIAVSLAVHCALLAVVALSPKRPLGKQQSEPIEVTLTAAPGALEAAPQMLPEPQAESEVQATREAPPPPKQMMRVEARPAPRVPKSHMRGGGNPDAPVVKNPSPTKSPKPSSRPASNAGGKAEAAPAPPHLLTSRNGTTPAGAVGRGSAPSGPGGKAEVPGGGPSYGPGVMGGPAPVYPKAALDRNWEGKVTLAVTVGADGTIAGVQVVGSSGHDALDQAAIRAVRKGWTFKPGMAKGKPAAGKVTVTFSFSKGEVSKG